MLMWQLYLSKQKAEQIGAALNPVFMSVSIYFWRIGISLHRMIRMK